MSDWSRNIILVYLAAVNAAAFFAMGLDKHRAKTGRWRIPEATLMTLAGIGGSIGCLAGMHVFRHKTRKGKFRFGVPAILLVQTALGLHVFGMA